MQPNSITIVLRAVVAGIAGGLVAALFVALVGEESIDAAIAIEEATVVTPGLDEEPIVSRPLQVVGGVLAAVLYGLFTGIVFGTVFAAIRHRIRVVDDFRRSVLLAAAAFLATAFIPAMKYPANPPAIGDPDTVGQRTLYYVTLVGAAIVLMVAVGLLYSQLRDRFDQPSAMALTALGGAVGFVVLMAIWPDSPDAVDPSFPAPLLWRFRLESLATLALSWATLGLVLGWLLTRRPPAAAPTG